MTARLFAIALFLGANLVGLAAQASETTALQTPPQTAQAKPGFSQEAAKPAADSYAAREQKAGETLKGFQGGDTVVIVGGTTVVIIVLIVVIVVLI